MRQELAWRSGVIALAFFSLAAAHPAFGGNYVRGFFALTAVFATIDCVVQTYLWLRDR